MIYHKKIDPIKKAVKELESADKGVENLTVLQLMSNEAYEKRTKAIRNKIQQSSLDGINKALMALKKQKILNKVIKAKGTKLS